MTELCLKISSNTFYKHNKYLFGHLPNWHFKSFVSLQNWGAKKLAKGSKSFAEQKINIWQNHPKLLLQTIFLSVNLILMHNHHCLSMFILFYFQTFYTITNTLRLSIYTSMNTFTDFKSWALALQNILDTLSDILNKCLRFSLIKIESVSITQANPRLVPSSHLLYILFH